MAGQQLLRLPAGGVPVVLGTAGRRRSDVSIIVGTDVHNSGDGTAAGVVALDAATGARRWVATTAPTTGEGGTGPGCGDVWGSPSVDLDRRLVFVGTGNCETPEGWGDAWTRRPTPMTTSSERLESTFATLARPLKPEDGEPEPSVA